MAVTSRSIANIWYRNVDKLSIDRLIQYQVVERMPGNGNDFDEYTQIVLKPAIVTTHLVKQVPMRLFQTTFVLAALVVVSVASLSALKPKSLNLLPPKRLTRDVSKVVYDDMVEDDEDDGIDWQCGTDDLSKMMSEASVEQTCPHLKASINNCCLAHDSCYDQQLGQRYCDDNFCRCLDVVTKYNKTCNQGESVIFCDLVRKYGAGPYAASARKPATTTSTTTTATATTTTTTATSPPTTIVQTTATAPAATVLSAIRPADLLILGNARPMMTSATSDFYSDYYSTASPPAYSYYYSATAEETPAYSSMPMTTPPPNPINRPELFPYPSFPFPYPYPS
uniref:Uncharacterized protein n=1 Tax=Syphacia muris TaxID=451379 RepID=A0A0N5ANH4_9BILA